MRIFLQIGISIYIDIGGISSVLVVFFFSETNVLYVFSHSTIGKADFLM